MAAMTMGDYGKDAPTGGGIRLRVLYDAIVNRELIEVESGGKALIMTSDAVLADMKKVIDGKLAFDSPDKTNQNNFAAKYSGKKVLKEIKKQAKTLQDLGYDTKMILVNTDLDTAIQRDKLRSRSLGKKKVTDYWKTVQSNIGAFQTMFGKKNFIVVDNSTGKDYQKETLRAYRDIKKFISKEPDNPLAKKWIKQEREKKKR